eukprot:COSAG04_NODE_4501_length_2049_cov_0.970256_2_plen_469_part_00
MAQDAKKDKEEGDRVAKGGVVPPRAVNPAAALIRPRTADAGTTGSMRRGVSTTFAQGSAFRGRDSQASTAPSSAADSAAADTVVFEPAIMSEMVVSEPVGTWQPLHLREANADRAGQRKNAGQTGHRAAEAKDKQPAVAAERVSPKDGTETRVDEKQSEQTPAQERETEAEKDDPGWSWHPAMKPRSKPRSKRDSIGGRRARGRSAKTTRSSKQRPAPQRESKPEPEPEPEPELGVEAEPEANLEPEGEVEADSEPAEAWDTLVVSPREQFAAVTIDFLIEEALLERAGLELLEQHRFVRALDGQSKHDDDSTWDAAALEAMDLSDQAKGRRKLTVGEEKARAASAAAAAAAAAALEAKESVEERAARERQAEREEQEKVEASREKQEAKQAPHIYAYPPKLGGRVSARRRRERRTPGGVGLLRLARRAPQQDAGGRTLVRSLDGLAEAPVFSPRSSAPRSRVRRGAI